MKKSNNTTDQEIAVKVNHVYKDFSYTSHTSSTIKSTLVELLHPGRRKENIKKNTQHALKDINFDIKKGEFFGIVGRNGSGKSTLLKIIAGIYQPNKGSVNMQGKLVPFIELGVGFNPELTGKENVYLNGALLGFDKSEIDSMYDQIVEFAELEKFMDQKLKNYSSGMQVRLSFSMAIRAKADILLIDEVLAVGDADFQRKCFDYFKKLKKDKKTVVFISHDMGAIQEYCSRAMLIDSNKVECIGAPEKISSLYKRLYINNDHKEEKIENNSILDRWGDGGVKFTEVRILNSTTLNADVAKDIIVSVDLLSLDSYEVTVGFSVSDETGSILFGTNTSILKIPKIIMKRNKSKTVTWHIPNIFNKGKYELNIAAIDSTGTVTFDWWDKAANFRIEREDKTPYPVNPQIKVEVSK
jgi:ABC-2 type transport system ATP-binding protein